MILDRIYSQLRPGERALTSLLLIIGSAALSATGVFALRAIATPIPHDGGTMREGIVGSIRGLDPLTCRESPAEADLCPLVFAGLTRLDPESNTTVTDLAERIALSGENRIYTVTIRADARFHDGTPVTADDVLFTYQTLLQDETFPGVLGAAFKGVTITGVDARTLTFALQKENAFFTQVLTIGVLPRHALPGVTATTLADHAFRQAPIGAGPMRITAFRHVGDTDRVTLQPVDPAASIETLEVIAYRDQPTLLGNLSALDAVKEASGTDVFDDAPGWRTVQLRLPRYVGLFFNTERGAVGSPSVRQALGMAAPRTKIVQELGDVANVWAPVPTFEQRGGVVLTEEEQLRRTKRAEELLYGAGWRISAGAGGTYRVKDGKQLALTLVTRRDADFVRTAEMLRDAWKELGVATSITVLQTAEDLQQGPIQQGDYDVLLVGITTGSDADLYPNFHSTQVGAGNFSRYKDYYADILMEKIRKTPDSAKQRGFAAELIDLLQRDAPAVFLYSPAHTYALRTSIDDVVIPPRLATISDRFALFSQWTIAHSYVWNAPGETGE